MKLELRTFPLKLLMYCEFLNSFSSLDELFSSSGQASLSCLGSVMLFAPYASANILGATITIL